MGPLIERLTAAMRARTPIQAAAELHPGDAREYAELALAEGKEIHAITATLDALKETIPYELDREKKTHPNRVDTLRDTWDTIIREAYNALSR